MNKKNLTLSLGLITVAAATRFLPHPPNFTAIGAMAIFGGAVINRKWLSMLLPMVVLFLSDLVLNNVVYASFYDGFTFFTDGAIYLYAAFAISAVMGMRLGENSKWTSALGISIGSSVVFFALSNFSAFATDPMYTKDAAGLSAAYIAGLPYFWSTLISTVVFTQILFAAHRVSIKKLSLSEVKVK